MGDSSDGIKGVPGIGKKTAKDLLNKYGNIEAMLANVADIKAVLAKIWSSMPMIFRSTRSWPLSSPI